MKKVGMAFFQKHGFVLYQQKINKLNLRTMKIDILLGMVSKNLLD